MNVNFGILDYMPLPQMPFDKVVPEWPSAQRVEETAKAIDEKVQKYKYLKVEVVAETLREVASAQRARYVQYFTTTSFFFRLK